MVALLLLFAAVQANELDNVRKIHDRIVVHQAASKAAQPYKVTIPNITIEYGMTPIPAGHFEMGGSKPDEQPKHQVTLDAFWMQTPRSHLG